jgi:hypothetical protein
MNINIHLCPNPNPIPIGGESDGYISHERSLPDSYLKLPGKGTYLHTYKSICFEYKY